MTDGEKIDALVNEYCAYCDKHGLPQLSADELLWEINGAEYLQHAPYLHNFINRWETAMSEIYGR